jgi:hypothetical protein
MGFRGVWERDLGLDGVGIGNRGGFERLKVEMRGSFFWRMVVVAAVDGEKKRR